MWRFIIRCHLGQKLSPHDCSIFGISPETSIIPSHSTPHTPYRPFTRASIVVNGRSIPKGSITIINVRRTFRFLGFYPTPLALQRTVRTKHDTKLKMSSHFLQISRPPHLPRKNVRLRHLQELAPSMSPDVSGNRPHRNTLAFFTGHASEYIHPPVLRVTYFQTGLT